MNQYQYYVERQGNTTCVTNETSTDPVEILHFGDDTVTFACTNIYDAIEIAEALIVGRFSKAAEEEYKGQLLFVDETDGLTIYVNCTRMKCQETGCPCCTEDQFP